MTATEDRKTVIRLIGEATSAGARQAPACSILGLSERNLAVARVYMHDPTSAALLNISNLDATTKQRMPTTMDFNFLPDMGRMIGNWQKREIHGFSLTHSRARRRALSSTVSC